MDKILKVFKDLTFKYLNRIILDKYQTSILKMILFGMSGKINKVKIINI